MCGVGGCCRYGSKHTSLYCIVGLGDVKVARTPAKPSKKESAFWAEEFLLDNLSKTVDTITVTLYSRGKVRDRNVGEVRGHPCQRHVAAHACLCVPVCTIACHACVNVQGTYMLRMLICYPVALGSHYTGGFVAQHCCGQMVATGYRWCQRCNDPNQDNSCLNTRASTLRVRSCLHLLS